MSDPPLQSDRSTLSELKESRSCSSAFRLRQGGPPQVRRSDLLKDGLHRVNWPPRVRPARPARLHTLALCEESDRCQDHAGPHLLWGEAREADRQSPTKAADCRTVAWNYSRCE